MKRVALGFRAHSGWAVLVAVAGDGRAPEVIKRRRIELIDAGTPGAKQPYHAAAAMPFRDAEKFIASAIDRTRSLTRKALDAAIEDLLASGYQAAGCGILLASGRPLPGLAATLASHALIHTAEGELFRNALVHASEGCDLPVTGVKEREMYDRAAEELRISAGELTRRLGEMGRALGPPWQQDQKLAVVVAWVALASRKK